MDWRSDATASKLDASATVRRITIREGWMVWTNQGVRMAATISGIVMLVALGGWHLRTRRHPRWREDRDARFYITIGYPLVAVATFFLVSAASGTDLDWVLGHLWALVAVSLFVCGFQALNAPAATATKNSVRGTAEHRPRTRKGESRLIGH